MSERSSTNELPEDLTDWEEELDNEYYGGLVEDLGPSEGEPVAARLENGSLLIVGGPGAGTLTDSATVRIQETPLVSERDTALSGKCPLLIMHRPHQNIRPVPQLIAEMQRAYGGDIALGVSALLPRISQKAHETWNDDCVGAAVKIADPGGYLLDGHLLRIKPIGERARRNAPYLADRESEPVVADVLDVQRQTGANLLLTSGRALDITAQQPSLDKLVHEGDEALASLQAGERLALNITISAAWLAQPTTRDALLGQLLDQEQFDIWHLRVQWPLSLRSWAQPMSEEMLRGYKRLAELAEDEQRTLLLPNTGLTGWFLQAFGAAGFGIGLFGSGNAFIETTGGGGGGAPIERYFEKQLLHTVERTAYDQLTRWPDYIVCDCQYCRALRAREVWSHDLAALHYALALAELTADTARAASPRGGQHGYIRRAIRSALAFASGKPLLANNSPQHLAVWDRIL